jgi:hypothetical protein
MLFFLEIIELLVVETNRCYHQYLDSLNDGRSPLPDPTLKVSWDTAEQLSTPFFGKTMKRDRFCHILRYLHFTDNRDEPDKER